MDILITSLYLLIIQTIYASEFVHPSKFDGSETMKKQAIEYIKDNVKQTYSQINMDDPVTLRMMEKEELDNFKLLTKVKNKKLLDNVINEYCSIGMCDYVTLNMMYNEELKASQKELEW